MQTIYDEAIAAMQPAIDKLLINYQQFGSGHEIDKSEQPQNEINDYLDELDVYYPGATKRKLKLAIRQFMTTLSCFQYRVLAKSKNITVSVWNPLEQTLPRYLAQHEGLEIVYRSNKDPYPTADVIADWISSNIQEDIATE